MSTKWLVREAVPNFVDREWEPVQLVELKEEIFNVPFIAKWKDTWGFVFDRFEIKPYNFDKAQDRSEHLIIAHFSSDRQTEKPSYWVCGYCTPESSEMAKDWRYKREVAT